MEKEIARILLDDGTIVERIVSSVLKQVHPMLCQGYWQRTINYKGAKYSVDEYKGKKDVKYLLGKPISIRSKEDISEKTIKLDSTLKGRQYINAFMRKQQALSLKKYEIALSILDKGYSINQVAEIMVASTGTVQEAKYNFKKDEHREIKNYFKGPIKEQIRFFKECELYAGSPRGQKK